MTPMLISFLSCFDFSLFVTSSFMQGVGDYRRSPLRGKCQVEQAKGNILVAVQRQLRRSGLTAAGDVRALRAAVGVCVWTQPNSFGGGEADREFPRSGLVIQVMDQIRFGRVQDVALRPLPDKRAADGVWACVLLRAWLVAWRCFAADAGVLLVMRAQVLITPDSRRGAWRGSACALVSDYPEATAVSGQQREAPDRPQSA